jgi:hypothetical protein
MPFESMLELDDGEMLVRDHATCAPARIWVVESLKTPTAVYGSWVAGAIEALSGSKAMDCNCALLTFKVADAVRVLLEVGTVAVTVAIPGDLPVAMPPEPMVAVALSEEAQDDTRLVTSLVLPSLKVPRAVNCACVLFAIIAVDGRTEIETRFDKSTVRVAGRVALWPPNVAVTVLTPELCPIASPLLLVMEAPDEPGRNDHVARLVTSWVDMSLKVAVAVNCF